MLCRTMRPSTAEETINVTIHNMTKAEVGCKCRLSTAQRLCNARASRSIWSFDWDTTCNGGAQTSTIAESKLKSA